MRTSRAYVTTVAGGSPGLCSSSAWSRCPFRLARRPGGCDLLVPGRALRRGARRARRPRRRRRRIDGCCCGTGHGVPGHCACWRSIGATRRGRPSRSCSRSDPTTAPRRASFRRGSFPSFNRREPSCCRRWCGPSTARGRPATTRRRTPKPRCTSARRCSSLMTANCRPPLATRSPIFATWPTASSR